MKKQKTKKRRKVVNRQFKQRKRNVTIELKNPSVSAVLDDDLSEYFINEAFVSLILSNNTIDIKELLDSTQEMFIDFFNEMLIEDANIICDQEHKEMIILFQLYNLLVDLNKENNDLEKEYKHPYSYIKNIVNSFDENHIALLIVVINDVLTNPYYTKIKLDNIQIMKSYSRKQKLLKLNAAWNESYNKIKFNYKFNFIVAFNLNSNNTSNSSNNNWNVPCILDPIEIAVESPVLNLKKVMKKQ